MKFTEQIENFPSPIIAIDENMFVAAKNYLAGITFPNIHVGAKINKYTNINFTREILSKDIFYGKEYTYFTCFDKIEGNNYTLLFISLSTFGEDMLPFNPIELYKEKIAISKDNSSDLKNQKRQYIRAIHSNLIKANYFHTFKGLFESKIRSANNETVELKKVCSALNLMAKNFLETIDIEVDYDHTMPSLVASISEINITALLVNSLFFAVTNSSDNIKINLNYINNSAQITVDFCSNYDFFKLYNSCDQTKTEDLNSAFSLCIAMELSKRCNIDYTIDREQSEGKTHYTICHSIPVKSQNSVTFSSKDTILELLQRYLLNVFYNEEI